ncbi:MAG: class I SAM-dependent methyltransferase [Planctomycetia bacterium]|nr:class I SAM-dependent methyltransferase [Planctomycetia bacterium]
MLAAITRTARRGLTNLLGLISDPLGRRQVSQQAHLTRIATHERAVWLWQVLKEHAEATRNVVVEQAERTRLAAGGDEWKVQELETLLRYLRKKDYLAAIRSGELDVPELHTEYPLAVDSNDTLHPRGAKNDNSICLRFNQRLYQLFNRRPNLKVLDLGCAGGGLVRTLIDDGHFAVGLEGSDYPLVNQAGEWGTIPRHLFTCDITRPFRLSSCGTGAPICFDAITAWEVMEHIPEDRIEPLMKNVDDHLAPGGWVLFSIATFPYWNPATGVVWHRTVQPREWWEAKFAELGFVPDTNHTFGPYDWLRGSGNGRYDWKPEDSSGFHIALRRKADVGEES